jgi:hypothetical protein
MSQINTNGINTNYPEPGTNNSSQGFRDNFSQIRTNLDTASNEITDLQNKVVVKTALNGTVLNNDMANTLISNASTSGFRATTYNLGNALSGTVLVDVNRADVQYGAVTGNLTLQFGGWAPTNTESNVVLRLAVANVDATISLPNAAVSANNNFGVTILENYQDVNGTATLTAPANVGIIEYTFSTLDCGNTISVSPNNRPFQATQILTRTPPPTGIPGDVAGTVAVDANYIYVCTDTFDSIVVERTVGNTFSGNLIQIAPSTNDLLEDAPIVFTGNVDTANTNLVANTVYYIKTIADVDTPLGNITISATRTSGTAGSTFAVGAKSNLTIDANAYVGTNIWKRVELSTW